MASLWQKIQDRSLPDVKLCIAVTTTAVGVVYAVHRWIIWSRVNKKIKRKKAKCKAAFESVENRLKALNVIMFMIFL